METDAARSVPARGEQVAGLKASDWPCHTHIFLLGCCFRTLHVLALPRFLKGTVDGIVEQFQARR